MTQAGPNRGHSEGIAVKSLAAVRHAGGEAATGPPGRGRAHLYKPTQFVCAPAK